MRCWTLGRGFLYDIMGWMIIYSFSTFLSIYLPVARGGRGSPSILASTIARANLASRHLSRGAAPAGLAMASRSNTCCMRRDIIALRRPTPPPRPTPPHARHATD